MSDPVIQTGAVGPIKLSDDYEWDPKNGPRAVQRYRGTRREIFGFLPTVQQGGNQIRVTQEGESAMFILELRASEALDGSDPSTEVQTQTLWTLSGNDREVSVLIRGQEKGLKQATIGAVRRAVQDVQTGASADADASESYVRSVAQAQGDNEDDAATLFRLVLEGTDSYGISQYVLRRQKTVPEGYVFLKSPYCGKIYTTAQILAEDNTIPQGIQNQMPSQFWLKRTPTIEQQSNFKLTLTDEWWHSYSYSTFIYDAVP